MFSGNWKLSSPDPISPIEQARERQTPEIAGISPPAEDPPWNLIDVLVIAVFGFLALVVFGTLALIVAHSLTRFHRLSGAELAQNAFVMVPAQTVAYLLLVGFMVHVVRLRTEGHRALWDRDSRYRPEPEIAFPRNNENFLTAISWNAPHGQTAFLAITGGIGLAFFSLVFTDLLSRWVPKSLPIDRFFRDTSSTYLLTLFGVLVAPFVEELFFRGFFYPALARTAGTGISMVVTAAAFAVVHQEQLAHAWVPLAWLFLFGIVQARVRAKTKSVATCVLIHTAYNATLFVLVFIQTQGFRHMDRMT